MQSEKNPRELSNQELIGGYQDNLDDYIRWIGKGIDLNDGWIEEAEYMSFARGEVHEFVTELEKRGLKFDHKKLEDADALWQKWIIGHADPSFKLEHNREGRPKEHWWEWIDQLGTLSQTQLHTL
jgi:hypothetical protein